MGSSSARADQVKEAGSLQCGAMGGSGGTEILPAAPPINDQASRSSRGVLSGAEKYQAGSVAEQIQQSQRHWSELSDSTSMPKRKKPFKSVHNLAARIFGGARRSDEEIAVESDNRKVFMELQSHSSWGCFFRTFGYTLGTPYPGMPGFIHTSTGEMRVGEKFAEGAQAELFDVHITWSDAINAKLFEERGYEFVMKVFKKGTLLRDLQLQWPLEFLQFRGEKIQKLKSPTYEGSYFSHILCGTLLEDGRFGFVMKRYVEDLRRTIERNMICRTNQDCGPFSKYEVECIMWRIAKGMDLLHSHNIVHRDLKASNVLLGKNRDERGPTIYIADYECSVGVVGTKFFRAPEILQACKDRIASRNPELYTKAVDVYSYGMTCYEILTGRLPFEGHPQNDYDYVINGRRPELPPYVDDWICDLLRRCWDANSRERPLFPEILSILVAKSVAAKAADKKYKRAVEKRATGQTHPTLV